MKLQTLIIVLFFLAYVIGAEEHHKHDPVYLPPVKEKVAQQKIEKKKRFVGNTLVGYIKIGSGGFAASAGCSATNLTTAAYTSSARCLGQISIGDVLTDQFGTAINGGGQGYGFVKTSGGNAHRGIKLNPDGTIGDISNCNDPTPPTDYPVVGFLYNSSGANCSQTSFPITNKIYIDPDDPAPRNNIVCYTNTSGAVLGNGTYTIASTLFPTTALATFTTTGGNGRITSIAYCVTAPQVYAGPDTRYSLPSPSVTVSADGSFSPSNCISLWSWSQQSGPNTATITSPNTISTTITGVVVGTYVFRATATDGASVSAFDEVSITIVPAPTCVGSTKLPIKNYMVFGPNGNFGQGAGSAATLDTFPKFNGKLTYAKAGNRSGYAYSLFDMDCDPWNNQFDANLSLAGFQRDSTLIKGLVEFPTLHHYYELGNGNEIVVVVDMGRPYNVERWAYYDSTLATYTDEVEVFVCNLDTASRAVFEYETGIPCVPSFTISTHDAPGFYYIDHRREKGQYLVFRFKPVGASNIGPVISSIWPYGCVATGAGDTADTRITPQFKPNQSRDTTYTVGDHHSGIVVATGVPGGSYWDDTLRNHRGQGGYIGVISPTQGLIDTFQNKPWRGITSLINSDIKYNIGPYGDLNIFIDSAYYYSGGVKRRHKYIVDKSAPARIYKETGFRILEIVPTDSIAADKRLSKSYGRITAQEVWMYALLGEIAPDVNSQYGQYISNDDYYNNNFAAGRRATGRVKYWIMFNENYAGYRAANDSNWMSPAHIRAAFDTLYQALHSTFPGIQVASQGFAAWGSEGLLESEFLQRLKYKNRTRKLWDIYNIHTTVSTYVHHVEKSYPGNVGSHSVFAGQRNEYWKLQTTLDTLNWYAGEWKDCIVTEYSVGSPRHYETPTDPLGTDAGITALGAQQIGSLPSEESQAYIYLSQQVDLEMTRGCLYSYGYEYGDAADTLSGFYPNNDNNNGRVNRTGTLASSPWYKPLYFVGRQHVKWLDKYRGIQYVADSLNGNRAALFRNVNSRDSFCLFVQWDFYSDPTIQRTYFLGSDVSTVLCLQHLNGDYTDAGTTISLTVTGGSVRFPPSYKGHYIFFKSTSLANKLDFFMNVNESVEMIN